MPVTTGGSPGQVAPPAFSQHAVSEQENAKIRAHVGQRPACVLEAFKIWTPRDREELGEGSFPSSSTALCAKQAAAVLEVRRGGGPEAGTDLGC